MRRTSSAPRPPAPSGFRRGVFRAGEEHETLRRFCPRAAEPFAAAARLSLALGAHRHRHRHAADVPRRHASCRRIRPAAPAPAASAAAPHCRSHRRFRLDEGAHAGASCFRARAGPRRRFGRSLHYGHAAHPHHPAAAFEAAANRRSPPPRFSSPTGTAARGSAMRSTRFSPCRALPRSSRGAVLLVLSDGLERGDPTAMADAVARFSRLAWRIVWLTPLAADPGFEPRTAGFVAARPYLDELGDGGSIDKICAHVLDLAECERGMNARRPSAIEQKRARCASKAGREKVWRWKSRFSTTAISSWNRVSWCLGRDCGRDAARAGAWVSRPRRNLAGRRRHRLSLQPDHGNARHARHAIPGDHDREPVEEARAAGSATCATSCTPICISIMPARTTCFR